jgi:hypothetical protein
MVKPGVVVAHNRVEYRDGTLAFFSEYIFIRYHGDTNLDFAAHFCRHRGWTLGWRRVRLNHRTIDTLFDHYCNSPGIRGSRSRCLGIVSASFWINCDDGICHIGQLVLFLMFFIYVGDQRSRPYWNA